MQKGKLYLIPSPLHETDSFLPNENVIAIIKDIETFIVENEKNARKYLRHIVPSLQNITLLPLHQHTQAEEYYSYLNACKQGKNVGLLSDCGCPGVADPGAEIVAMAHSLQIEVIPIVGPSSILLSLMASGLQGQRFTFNGYLPIKEPDRTRQIKNIESQSRIQNATQIFIETPYRNHALFELLLKTLKPTTMLCYATMINTTQQSITTKSIADWRKQKPNIQKQVAIFLILA